MRQARLSSLVAASQKLTRRTGRALLLAGVAIAVVCVATAEPAAAQTGNRLKAPSAPLPDDGLGPKDLLLQADTLIRDTPNNTVTALGHVQARYQGRTLRTDRLDYNTVTGAAHAVGHSVIVNADGTTQYGDDVTLDDQFRAAISIGFAAREADNVTLAAGAAIRRNETVNELKNAVYTVCNICAENGAPKHPSWTIQATTITEDREHQVIYYRNALVRVLGIPVFYSPIFWHPDPSSPRRSGLLAPMLEDSSRRGFSYEQPYLFTLGPSADLIVSPQLNTRVNPELNVRLTERFYSGMIDLRAGYTYSEIFDNHSFFDNDTSRSYILGRGLFNIDKNWVWGFGAERVTDPTFFQRYHITDVYTDRGPFPTDTDRLISQLYTVRSDAQTYVSVAAMDFQSLRAFGATPQSPHGTFESSATFPAVAPLVEIRYDPTEDVFGGQLTATATAVALSRNKEVLDIYDPSGAIAQGPVLPNASNLSLLKTASNFKQLSALQYLDSRRIGADVDWRTSFTLDSGIRVEPFLYGRADAYSITNAQVWDQSSQSFVPGKDNVERIYGTAGTTVSWPFIKPIGNASVILEPMAQIAVSPVEKVNPNIPNEDSPSFEYDETNLFDINRFQGFDLLEGGDRLNVGGRATVDWGVNHNATFIVGRTFRAQDDPQFTALSGLAGTASDWIVSATASPITGLTMFTRSRLDADDFSVHREEAGISYGGASLNGYVRYDLNESGLFQTFTAGSAPIGTTTIGRTEDISVGGQAFFTQHWGVSANVTRDMQQDIFPLAQVGLIYRDECIRVDILYTHDETAGAEIGTSNAVTFRITLATLGDNGPLTPAASSRGSR
ncbi:MAG: LPS assembly protein LptD [Caulobacteraceae bacterium]